MKKAAKVERKDITMSDLEGAMRQVLSHPTEPKIKNENREPTKKELSMKWKLDR